MDRAGFNHIGVAGGGAWGTALACMAASAGRRVTLWVNDEALASQIHELRENKRFLAGVRLPPGVTASADPGALAVCDLVLAVSPAQRLRATLQLVRPQVPLLVCAKGIERHSGVLMSEIASEAAGPALAGILSGPSFARDVANGLPCAVTIAFSDEQLARRVCEALSSLTFRPYASSDVTGVAIGGAVKNVLAIACGIVEGRGLGESARAALLTRGFAEMARFGAALGARLETMSGLSGFGDLVLTASSLQSRNFSLGVRLAKSLPSAANEPLAEGAATAPALVVRARALGVPMPIAEAVAGIVTGAMSVDAAIQSLLARPLKSEH